MVNFRVSEVVLISIELHDCKLEILAVSDSILFFNMLISSLWCMSVQWQQQKGSLESLQRMSNNFEDSPLHLR